MYGERAAIAVLGPARFGDARGARLEEAAASVGRELARLGYAIIVEGEGQTAAVVARHGRLHDGRVAAIAVPRAARLDVVGAETETRPTLFQALERVLELADAIIVLPGDLRSLALLTQVWAWGLEPDAPYRQIVLLGEGWPDIVRALADATQMDQKTRAMVTFAREPLEAVEALRYYISPKA